MIDIDKKTILLTGGCGYIGSHTYLALTLAGYNTIILDDLSNSHISVLSRMAEATGVEPLFYRGSVLDVSILKKIVQKHKIDAVIHFAALKSISESFSDPNKYFETNISGLLNTTSILSEAGIRKLVFSSSATVYGEVNGGVAHEDTKRSYVNPYGFTKLVGEQILEQLAEINGWAVGILRYFNPVGADSSLLIGEAPRKKGANLFPHVVRVAMGDVPFLGVYGSDFSTVDGTGIRDYIHITDLAQGHLASVQSLFEKNTSHVVNIGTGKGHSVLDVVNEFERVSGKKIPVKLLPRRPGDVACSVANPSKAISELGFVAEHSLSSMCESAWKWEEVRRKVAL